MLVTNTLKRKDLGVRGMFAIIHEDTGRIYAEASDNIHRDLSKLMNDLAAGKCRNAKLQRYYDQDKEFQALVKISDDGMRGAKKDLSNFKSGRLHLLVN